MENEEITKEPSEERNVSKTKDPKRVAAGKKLAEINKRAREVMVKSEKAEAKARARAEAKAEVEAESSSFLPSISFESVLAIVGIGLTAFSLYVNHYSSSTTQACIQAPAPAPAPAPSTTRVGMGMN